MRRRLRPCRQCCHWKEASAEAGTDWPVSFTIRRSAASIQSKRGPGFAEVLERIEGNGVRTVIVETANRFARDLMVRPAGRPAT
jgi:hypothetical protein